MILLIVLGGFSRSAMSFIIVAIVSSMIERDIYNNLLLVLSAPGLLPFFKNLIVLEIFSLVKGILNFFGGYVLGLLDFESFKNSWKKVPIISVCSWGSVVIASLSFKSGLL